MQQATLLPGDYVLTKGMTEEQYHAVARAFINAGATIGEYPNTRYAFRANLECFGASLTDCSLFHGDREGLAFRGGRQLTVDQVLNATNAGNKETDMQNWKPEVGKLARNGNGNRMVLALDVVGGVAATRNLENGKLCLTPIDCLSPPMTEEDEAVKDMKRIFDEGVLISIDDRLRNIYRAGYQKQPTEDMSDPANWRAGDWLECVRRATDLTVGDLYQVLRMDGDNDPVIDDDADKSIARPAFCFRFHSRSK